MAKGDSCAGSKAGVAFTKEEDAIILDLVPRGKPLSAAVRLRRNHESVVRRYGWLVTNARSRSKKPRGSITPERLAEVMATPRDKRKKARIETQA